MLEWLDEHLTEPLTLHDVAAHAHMSERTLERRFRAETGDSLAGWIARRRVERARALLEDSDLTVSGVAHAVGFGSTESMRRHFVAQTGTTPQLLPGDVPRTARRRVGLPIGPRPPGLAPCGVEFPRAGGR